MSLILQIVEYRVMFAPGSFRQYAIEVSPSLLTTVCNELSDVALGPCADFVG